MAGLRDLKRRILSVQSIQKVTTAMSNIANAKLALAWPKLEHARAFSSDLEKVVFSIQQEPTDVVKDARYYIVGSDAGLCGSVNTLLVRHVREIAEEKAEEGVDVKLWLSGNKIHVGLGANKQSIGGVSDVYKTYNYSQTTEYVADLIEGTEEPQEHTFWYQRMNSPVTFGIHSESIPTTQQIARYRGTVQIDGDNDVKRNLSEFILNNTIHRIQMEQQASELSSRSAAMQNAAKAAEDMVDELQLTYRKIRQAKITTEIIEISTGAQAVMAQEG